MRNQFRRLYPSTREGESLYHLIYPQELFLLRLQSQSCGFVKDVGFNEPIHDGI